MDLTALTEKLKFELTDIQQETLYKAYDVALNAHKDQFRESGEPYISHPLAVAILLADYLEMDFETIVAGLLHDVVEDSATSVNEIKKIFGARIALLVDGVTKLTSMEGKTRTEQQAHNLHKMFLAMSSDIRVVIIKLADRLHNIRTLNSTSMEKQKRVAQETLEIYAPLANRLGMNSLKSELEDQSLRYIRPERYQEIRALIDKKRSEREGFVTDIINTLEHKLSEVNIKAEIKGRPKHFFGIYKKMVDKNKSFDEIYDLTAVRIIVDSVKDCYGALGVVHTMWTPLPGRFKDYIAMPKPNMYQSLHTTVIGLRKEPVEIQIRTVDMHHTAEYGIAAHWKYKEGASENASFESKLAWLRQVIEFQQELKDVEEFVDSLKVDLFSDQVFVFTPKGDVVDLPSGAVPIDFAYRIHTEVGNRCIGAKINGAIVSLDYQLQTGDIVQILTSKSVHGPSRDWLNIVKTSSARSRIRQWFKREQREENIIQGQDLLITEIKKAGIEVKDVLNNKEYDFVSYVLDDFNYNSFDDLLAAIGYGSHSPYGVANRFIDYYREKYEPENVLEKIIENEQQPTIPTKGIEIQGINNALLKLARCCNPIPGDQVIGYITRGKGVTIHRVDCSNILAKSDETDRFIDVMWNDDQNSTYPVPLQIMSSDRPGVIFDILGVISSLDINISTLHSRRGIVYVTLDVLNLKMLQKLMSRIKSIHDVHEVRRV
ncbi:bifunctional (p)ppGpp synthetase/guanosine-3',5'-bis(diphosphate) 3'-pyrophosphohydrolase [Clostridium sp. 'deep sea']|uniref:RelA/SpoT family protein n=1 Tax=Clostridium sp. 'deep sea' TaxID=2779445 RepID=UPI0018965A7A|nr:bifunctional (p)ppGpp synthetase/guanosine-3',5'-bis(diphosphate) 3'-pyrophosphohydrolase [Clostridium sp. 'deep sea']QOR35687.1 bifunctional (p)ppGpp synthetase/guanosine-3',5'-bis(diphosphate) 3'-pyrophosphohydrolase [Clostridium sp. 'deep sea']